MVWGYVYGEHRFLTVEKQKEIIHLFAQKYQIKLLRFRLIGKGKNIQSYNLKEDDTLIVSDILTLGSKFEEVITTLKGLSDKKIRIYSVSENLMLDNIIPHLTHSMLDSCLKIYKGTLSIKNKKIQADLLEQGKDRGRPKNKTFLDENIEQLCTLLKTDLSITDIAKKMNVSRTTLFAFLRRKNLKREDLN